ncbi:MAG: hypothetical protein J2P48_22255 [Alphaproteobacteria bacterium]|nr:hypothetical protein [Alphaproteobacteria bacterium]
MGIGKGLSGSQIEEKLGTRPPQQRFHSCPDVWITEDVPTFRASSHRLAEDEHHAKISILLMRSPAAMRR